MLLHNNAFILVEETKLSVLHNLNQDPGYYE